MCDCTNIIDDVKSDEDHLSSVNVDLLNKLNRLSPNRINECFMCYKVIRDMANTFQCVSSSCKETHPVHDEAQRCPQVQARVKQILTLQPRMDKEEHMSLFLTRLDDLKYTGKQHKQLQKEIFFSGSYVCRICEEDFDKDDIIYVCKCDVSYHVSCTRGTQKQVETIEESSERSDAEVSEISDAEASERSEAEDIVSDDNNDNDEFLQ